MVVADVVDATIIDVVGADVVVAVAVGVVPADVADPSSTVVAAVSNVTFVVVAVSEEFILWLNLGGKTKEKEIAVPPLYLNINEVLIRFLQAASTVKL